MSGLFLHCYTCLLRLITAVRAWWCFLLTPSTCNFIRCSCTGYFILNENYKLFWTKSRNEIRPKIKGPDWNWNVAVEWWCGEGGVINFFQRSDASCNVHPPVASINVKWQLFLYCILHLCKLCSNSFDEFQFQVFPQLSFKTTPWSAKILVLKVDWRWAGPVFSPPGWAGPN